MFDPVTTALIASAPALDGVDLIELPQQFTRVFADIVSARVRLRDNPEGNLSAELIATLTQMRKIAAAHEALVTLIPGRENRAAAAFVAATAHQAFALGRTLSGDQKPDTMIDSATISPEVCATLLFMIAESYADGAEASKTILPSEDNATLIEKSLLSSIGRLARGELRSISAMAIPEIDFSDSLGEQAHQALLLELFKGVRNLALQLQLRVDLPVADGGVESARAAFDRVKNLCIDELEGVRRRPGMDVPAPRGRHLP